MAIQIPHQLVENLGEQKVVLFVGSGMSQPQLPGWRGLLDRLMQQAARDGVPIDPHTEHEVEELIANGELLVAAGKIKQVLDKDFHPILSRVFSSSRAAPTGAHKLLPSLRLRAIITTNYDKLIEAVYPGGARVCVYPAVPALTEDFFIWKLHGDIGDAESIVFDEADYDALSVNQRTETVLNGLFQNNTLLFVGYGLKDPDLLLVLKTLATVLQQQAGPHFALMWTKGIPQWERDRFRNHYRIRIFGDDARDDIPDIEKLFQQVMGHPLANSQEGGSTYQAVQKDSAAVKRKSEIKLFGTAWFVILGCALLLIFLCAWADYRGEHWLPSAITGLCGIIAAVTAGFLKRPLIEKEVREKRKPRTDGRGGGWSPSGTGIVITGTVILLVCMSAAVAMVFFNKPVDVQIKIQITQLPPIGEGGPTEPTKPICGKVSGVDPKRTRVIVYALTDHWFVQPYLDSAKTGINPDGTWCTDSRSGRAYAALLVKAQYSPPEITKALPQVGDDIIASTIVPGKEE